MGKFIDLTGQRFGRLVASRHESGRWACVCDCGSEVSVKSQDVRTGHTRSCGCLAKDKAVTGAHRPALILSGKYGRLTVIGRAGSNAGGSAVWKFSCDCGAEHTASARHVISGAISSCGCLRSEVVKQRMTGLQLCAKHDLGDLRGKPRKLAYIRMRHRTDPDFRARADARHKRRQRAIDSVTGTLTPKQWATILDCFQGRCAYCNQEKRLGQDHVIPLSRGGTHSWDNVVPACRSCNSKKNAKQLGIALIHLGTDPDLFWKNIRTVEERLAS